MGRASYHNFYSLMKYVHPMEPGGGVRPSWSCGHQAQKAMSRPRGLRCDLGTQVQLWALTLSFLAGQAHAAAEVLLCELILVQVGKLVAFGEGLRL